MLGKLLDRRYLILRVLGSGGFGQTYLAQDTRRPGTPKCVVKHLKPVTQNPNFLETARRLFNSEAETLEYLGNHDQIPRLLAYFEEDQEFFLVEDFVEGHTLKAELLPGQRWTEDQVLQFLQQVLAILQFIHSHQVIHRDLKPDNIIRRQQDSRFVLIDFGAVKQVQSQLLTVMGHIQTTIVIGTPGYMSTEQGRGKPRPCSDIYSLGIIGIQALTGLHPTQFEEDPITGEISWQHRASVSSKLAYVLSKMVLHHFKERYQSATEVLQSLGYLNNQVEQPLSFIQQPQVLLSQQNSIEHLPVASVLSVEKYNRLEKLLLEFIGPVAPRLLQKIAASATNTEELITQLTLHLTENQKTDFQQKTMFLSEKSTFIQKFTIKPDQPETEQVNISNQETQEISDRFVQQCESELIELIGPIAKFLVQKAVKSSSQISRTELVKILASQIPDHEKSLRFQHRLLS